MVDKNIFCDGHVYTMVRKRDCGQTREARSLDFHITVVAIIGFDIYFNIILKIVFIINSGDTLRIRRHSIETRLLINYH